jgi:hypothetical protein
MFDTIRFGLEVATGILASVSLPIALFCLLFALFDSKRRAARMNHFGIWTSIFCVSTFVYFGVFSGGRLVRTKDQGRLTACKSNLKNIGTAMEMYAMDNQGQCPDRLEALAPSYLKSLPECPSAHQQTYTPSYQFKRKVTGPKSHSEKVPTGLTSDDYTVYCQGDHHAQVGMPADYPLYSSLSGLIEMPSRK